MDGSVSSPLSRQIAALVLDMEFATIPDGSEARSQFELDFREDVPLSPAVISSFIPASHILP